MSSKLLFNVHSHNSGDNVPELLEHSINFFGSTDIFDLEEGVITHVNLRVEAEKELTTILVNSKSDEIKINFIGNVLSHDSDSAESILNLMKLVTKGNFYHTQCIDDKIVTREILVKRVTTVIQNTPLIVVDEQPKTVPVDILDHFHVHNVHSRNGVINVLKGEILPKWVLDNEKTICIKTTGQILLMDTGRDYEKTRWLTKLSNIYKNVVVRTQREGEVLDFVRFTPREDTYLRLASNRELISGGCFGIRSTKIFKEGYVCFDPTIIDSDGDAGGYRLTEKGKQYRENNLSRKSVQKGLAIGDVVIDIRDGSLHKVNDYDCIRDQYLLCGETFGATSINILFNNTHYHAYTHEVEKMNSLMA